THATIVDVHRTDARTAVVTCEVAAPILFAAGQYAQLHLPGDRPARAFSFANAPGGRQLEFHVRLLESGVASEYFRERAKANDVVTLDAPLGYFYLRPGSGPVVMVAGGTGIAPFLSMLNHMHQHGTPTRDIHVLYGAATAEGLSGRRRLQTLQTELPQLTVDYFVDNDTDDEELRSGSVCTGLTPELFGRDVDVYLCGPPAMVETAEGMLQAFGVPDARTFTERFVPT
nr:oxidoreductase [Gammaproteobacteria bacterium]